MKRMLLIIVLLAIFVSSTYASIRRICYVQYRQDYGWSKVYKMEVQFITGMELNQKTLSYKYDSYAKYALLWFSDGGVAILKISDYFVCGSDFDRDAFLNLFSYKSSITCEQINSESEDPPIWRITAKDYMYFIDPREN